MKSVFLVQDIPDYDDSMSVWGVYTTRRRAENALKRQGYRQPYPKNRNFWRSKTNVDLEVSEYYLNADLGRYWEEGANV